MIWQDEGGGRRAKHCVAMSLFALGHEVEAAAGWMPWQLLQMAALMLCELIFMRRRPIFG